MKPDKPHRPISISFGCSTNTLDLLQVLFKPLGSLVANHELRAASFEFETREIVAVSVPARTSIGLSHLKGRGEA
jgi:hypothetical protein